MIKVYLTLLLFSAVLLVYSGCKDTVTGNDIDERDKDIPDTNVSFVTHIQPVLEVKCNNAGCHNDETRAGNLSLSSYANVTSDLSVVFPGEPQNSMLVQVIQPGAAFPMPPLGYAPLTPKQVQAITTWVKEGAKNN